MNNTEKSILTALLFIKTNPKTKSDRFENGFELTRHLEQNKFVTCVLHKPHSGHVFVDITLTLKGSAEIERLESIQDSEKPFNRIKTFVFAKSYKAIGVILTTIALIVLTYYGLDKESLIERFKHEPPAKEQKIRT
ncbi:hypothetical protein [Cellvibrio sp. OA-2007]|uniref:hypothetical protein n=1 Tax=Cellvibrio sp. OA-2007 TaxID=529823 RepID=UPI000780E415|nr:hypothetical protein [Cellvibrio sp. OA-2007]